MICLLFAPAPFLPGALAAKAENSSAPAAPSGLTAKGVGVARINLTWTDNASDEDGFKIERKLTSGGTFTQIATVGANDTSFASLNLTANTQYTYRVRAYNAGGNSDYSNEATASTLPNPPAAPGALTATAVSSSQIDLTWADNSDNETGFKIERKTGAAGTYAQIATVGADVTSFSNTGLTANTEYFYRVRANNAGGNSAYSNEANATTITSVPATPSGLAAATVSSSRINLSWTDNSSNEDGFKIEIKIGAAGTYVENATIGANVTTYSSTGLDASTQYFYRVRAYNVEGYSAYSNETSATTLPDPPATPSSLQANTVSATKINLTWTDNANNETGFAIERRLSSAITYTQIATIGANVTTYSNTGLIANTEYFYRVRAFNAGGNSGYSNVVSATTLLNPPAPPGGLTATTVSNSRIDLAWADSANNEEGFKIERKTLGGAYAEIAAIGANVTHYSNTGLTANTQYFYRVRAFNTGGNSVYSNEVNAMTLPNPPVPPGGLTATAMSNNQIDLAWTDNASNEDGFKIERKTGGAGAYAEIATVGANVTSFSSSGLAGNTEYFYRIRAYNTGGNSDYSNEANTITLPNPPAAPGNLIATAVSYKRIDLVWADSANNEEGFTIERKTGLAGTYAEIVPQGVIGANVTSFSDTSGLSPSTKYFYRLRAYNTGGNSGYTNVASATTLPNPPTAPSSLTAVAVSSKQINLTWTDNANTEDGFKIERKTGTAGTYAEIAIVGPNVIGYANTGLNVNTKYFYRVLAYKAGSNSAYSNEASATTLRLPPAQPSSLTATAISGSQVNLTWMDNSTNESGFKIERKTGAAGTYAGIATVGADVASYSSSGLAGNTEYFYRVRAYNNGGNSSYSNEASATTLSTKPPAPGNLTAVAVSNKQINLAWADSANNEDGFKIERKTGLAGTFAEIVPQGGIGANVINFSDTTLTANTKYFYRVRAYNSNGNSAYSNQASAATLKNPPNAPANLAANPVSSTRIDLAWMDKSANEDGFKIERKTGAAGTYAEIATLAANTTAHSDTGLIANTQYFYRVRAYNNGGNSSYSNEASATTWSILPTTPSNLTAVAVSNKQINLAWADSANNENGFKIERKTGLAGTFAQIATVGANVINFSDTTLTANTKYFYRVRAYNSNGNSAYSNQASAVTLKNPPNAPANLAATTVSSTRIDLAWMDKSANEDGFTIERKTGAAGTYAEIATLAANTTTHSDTGLTANTQYFYRVRAFNSGGNSSSSNEASATTLSTKPPAPSNLTAVAVSNKQINLAWADSVNNEDGFRIERKTGLAGTFAEITTVGANVINFSDTTLTANTKYFYRVRAYNSNGNSAYSNQASAATLKNPPNAPANLAATAVSSTRIDLAWMDKSANEDGFTIERKTGLAGTYAVIDSVGANVVSYSSTGLSAKTTYFYRVRAYNSGGNSSYSNEASATTWSILPTTPSNLTAVAVSNKQINLAWADSANNENGFKIERKTGLAGTFAEIATVGANVINFSDTTLTANTKYFYRVRAYNSNGNSTYSNQGSAVTLKNPPNAPTNLAVTTVSNTRIDLAWTDNSANEDGFKIERKTGAGTYAVIDSVGANVESYSSTGLNAKTKYFYRVCAYNNGGNSSYSNEASATTLPNAPKAPSGLSATTVSNTQIDLAWADSSANEVNFKIERKTGVAGTYAEIATVGANVTSYSNSGLTGNTEYFYRVRASNTGGNSAYSNEANATTLPNPPTAPSSLAATAASNKQINLTWTDGATTEAGFKIERKTGAAGTYAEIATLAANTTAHSDTGLTANTQYFYRVRAFNTGGNSAYSNEANATTLQNLPSAPSGLTATVMSTTQINLAWTDNASDETGFKIERKTGAAGTYAEIATVGANVTSYSNTGLVVNTTYYYRVRASSTGGNSPYSNEANATTPSGGNLALNKPITASSTDTLSAATRAVDGITTTYWRSGFVNASSPPEWLRVELDPSSNMPIGRAVVTWYQNYHALEYEFQLSTDGTNWTTVYTNTAGTLGTQDFTFTTMMARFARLYMKKNAKSNYRVAELEVYAGSLTKDAASSVEAANLPTTITLEQNYPNPFNPATTIAYSLPEDAHVTLRVINIAGQEVATLAEGYQGRGTYRFMFKARNLPSGIYYVVLKAGNVTQVKQMVLAK